MELRHVSGNKSFSDLIKKIKVLSMMLILYGFELVLMNNFNFIFYFVSPSLQGDIG